MPSPAERPLVGKHVYTLRVHGQMYPFRFVSRCKLCETLRFFLMCMLLASEQCCGQALYRDRHHPQGSCRHAAEGLLARLQAGQNRPGRAFDPKDLWFGDVDRQWHQAWRAWTRSPQLPRESATPGPSRPRASWCASVSTATDSVPASSANDGVATLGGVSFDASGLANIGMNSRTA